MFETKEGPIKPVVYVGIINKNRLLLVEYLKAPNPTKSGLWIPAPGLEYGEDPQAKVQNVCAELGILPNSIKLSDVESFVSSGGWHLICHYVVQTDSEPTFHSNIKSYRCVTSEELADMKDVAHGKWEIDTGQSYLRTNCIV